MEGVSRRRHPRHASGYLSRFAAYRRDMGAGQHDCLCRRLAGGQLVSGVRRRRQPAAGVPRLHRRLAAGDAVGRHRSSRSLAPVSERCARWRRPSEACTPQTVLDDVEWATYAPSGHLLFQREDSVFAAPFDPVALKLAGPARLMADAMAASKGPQPLIAVSSTGHLLTVPATSGDRTLVWVGRDGTVTPLPAPAAAYVGDLSLSPDGQTLALAVGERSRQDLWLYDLRRDRSPLTRLTHDDRADHWTPAWSKDGDAVVFFSGPRPGLLWRIHLGSERAEPLWSLSPGLLWTLTSARMDGGASSPDGRRASRRISGYCRSREASERLARSSIPRHPRSRRGFRPTAAGWPTRRARRAGTRFDVRDFPQMTGRVQVSLDGGERPRWTATSGELFFQDGDR